MQISRIMIAVATLSAAGVTFAAPASSLIAVSSGASATKGNLKTALTNLCQKTAGGAATGYFLTEFTTENATDTKTNSNISTYVCGKTSGGVAIASSTDYNDTGTTYSTFLGTAFAELRLNVGGGSFTAVCALNNWPTGTACDTVNVVTNSIQPVGADQYRNPAISVKTTTGYVQLPQTGQTVVGGLMDVGPTTWPTTVTAGLSLPADNATGVAQTFGVAVSDSLYRKLYAAQRASTGGATIDKPIPSTCPATLPGINDALSGTNFDVYKSVECIPTISKGQMATIMANNEFNAAYSNGVGYLTGVAGDNGTVLEYNRRADTSGTQAAAQAYFLGLPCTGNALTIVTAPAVGSSTTIGAIKVFAHAGTGDLRNELNVTTAGVYGIGIMSGENNQTDTGTTWKWLRVQGAAIGESAKPGNVATLGILPTNSKTVTNGSYDYYYESKYVGNTGFWGPVVGALNTLTAPLGLLNTNDLATYNKGTNACQYNSSN